MSTLRVVAVAGALVPFFDASGRMIRGRHVGRDAAGRPAPETVDDTPYHRNALAHGDLALAPEATAPTTEEPPRDPA